MPFKITELIQETRDVLFFPRRYFQTLGGGQPWGDAIPKVVVYGLAAGIVVFLWSVLNLGPLKQAGLGFGLVALIGLPLLCVLLLPAAALLLYLVALALGGRKDYGLAARSAASITVILPLNYLIGFVSGLSVQAALAGLILVLVWVLILSYLALTRSFGVKKLKAKILIVGLIAVTLGGGIYALRQLGRAQNLPPEVKETLENLEQGTINPADVERVQKALREALNKTNP